MHPFLSGGGEMGKADQGKRLERYARRIAC